VFHPIMFSNFTRRAFLLAALLVLTTLTSSTQAYSVSPKKTVAVVDTVAYTSSPVDRRTAFTNFLGAAAGAGVLLSSSSPALASGGATAGKYTTIPIAKR